MNLDPFGVFSRESKPEPKVEVKDEDIVKITLTPLQMNILATEASSIANREGWNNAVVEIDPGEDDGFEFVVKENEDTDKFTVLGT